MRTLRSKFDKVKVAESRTLYNKHGRRVVLDTLEFADGSRYEWVYFSGWGSPSAVAGAVAVAAFTKDNKMVLTKQYRHPLGKMINDLPAGGIHTGETPKQTALRELEEETGYTTDKLKWMHIRIGFIVKANFVDRHLFDTKKYKQQANKHNVRSSFGVRNGVSFRL